MAYARTIELSKDIHSTLAPDAVALVADLFDVGSALAKARAKYPHISKVISHINEKGLDFKLELDRKERTERLPVNPLLRTRLNVSHDRLQDKGEEVARTTRVKIKSRRYDGIRIDGNSSFRDGWSDCNWAVYKSLRNDKGTITAAAIYAPRAGIAYVADADAAYAISFAKPEKGGILSKLKISAFLERPFTAEHGSWHRKTFSIPKALYTTLIRENVGGSIRETGMKQMPFIWVATGERGLVIIGKIKPDADRTGMFIAGKAGVPISEIPIESGDPESHFSVIAAHPSIKAKVLEHFEAGVLLSDGTVRSGRIAPYAPAGNVIVT